MKANKVFLIVGIALPTKNAAISFFGEERDFLYPKYPLLLN